MAVALILIGFTVFLFAATVLLLELGLRLALVLAWTVAWLIGRRSLALFFKLTLAARSGSLEARIALRRLWIEANPRRQGLAV